MNESEMYYGKVPKGTKPEDFSKVMEQMISEMKKSKDCNYEGERFVLFLDILGFKDLIEKNSIAKVEKIYKHQVIESMGIALERGFDSYNIPYVTNPILDGNKLIDTIHGEFNSHIMSDSIVIWTNDDSPKSFSKICAFATTFLSYTFILGVPLRGAISKGYISEMKTNVNGISQSCVVGTGIVNAYKLEGKQEWMGCIVDKECIVGLGKEVIDKIHSHKEPTSIVKYKVPIKDDKYSDEYVINWVHTTNKNIIKEDLDYFNDCFSCFNKNIELESVRKKILNTLTFYKVINKINR